MPDHVGTPAFNVLSLCSGTGGLDLGLRLAVAHSKTICYVEHEAYCCAVLAARMEEGWLDQAPLWSDLRTFDGKPWRGVVDCVIGGYPCQGFSSAARGRHTQADLGGEVLRVVSECQPSFVFLENVSQARRSLAGLRKTLWGMGYRSPPLLACDASDVGAPHERRRLFLLAHSDRHGQPRRALHDEVAKLPPDRPSLWERKPKIVGVDDGTPNRMERLRACGNGVVPLVAAYAWRTLAATLEV